MTPMTPMTCIRFIPITAAALALLAGCHNARELDQASATRALTAYLDQRGDLCLAKNSWPIVVTDAEARAGSRNAVQMPVLERLGVVEGASIDGGRRYALTVEGRKYYLARPPRKTPTGNRFADAPGDLCAAHLTLDRVVGWEKAAAQEAVVTYTYHVQPAPWTQDAGARAVFPMVDTIIRGEGQLQLKQTIVLAPGGWEAKDS